MRSQLSTRAQYSRYGGLSIWNATNCEQVGRHKQTEMSPRIVNTKMWDREMTPHQDSGQQRKEECICARRTADRACHHSGSSHVGLPAAAAAAALLFRSFTHSCIRACPRPRPSLPFPLHRATSPPAPRERKLDSGPLPCLRFPIALPPLRPLHHSRQSCLAPGRTPCCVQSLTRLSSSPSFILGLTQPCFLLFFDRAGNDSHAQLLKYTTFCAWPPWLTSLPFPVPVNIHLHLRRIEG